MGLQHTVDGNGDALVEDKSIGADEGGNLAELVVFEELGFRLRCVRLHNVDVQTVSLRDREQRSGARVGLGVPIESAFA